MLTSKYTISPLTNLKIMKKNYHTSRLITKIAIIKMCNLIETKSIGCSSNIHDKLIFNKNA